MPKRSVNADGRAVISNRGDGQHGKSQSSQQRVEVRKNDGRPRILVLDKDRARSPLLTQFYEYISRPDGPLAVTRDNRVNRPAELVIKHRYRRGEFPDYIYWGFTRGTALQRSAEFINRHNIKVIADIGDLQYFNVFFSNLSMIKQVRFLIARWPHTPGYKYMHELESIKKSQPFMEDSKIINVPWGINPDKYKSVYAGKPRDMDVSMICSSGNKYYHHNRRLAIGAIRRIKGISSYTKSVYGQKYIDMLYRSKIFVVEGSRRNFLVQKYLEAAVCGAMLMGEIPQTGKHIFVHGESIASIGKYSKLAANIKYYLNNPAHRDIIAQHARKRVLKHYSIDKTTALFESAVVADHAGKSTPARSRTGTGMGTNTGTARSKRKARTRTSVSVSPRRVGRGKR